MNHGGPFDLTDKVAVVTGGSRGLGRAIAQALAEAGADVVIASRKLDSCESAAEQIAQSTGRRAIPVACHVGRWDDCGGLIDATLDKVGRIDVLVNNAGMSPLYDELVNITEELYDKTLAVNSRAHFASASLQGRTCRNAMAEPSSTSGLLGPCWPVRTNCRMRARRPG
jgi:NAD(P)-dependent dehydrogenase (short-subunit alcohol dehydrogenase family)